MGLLQTVFGALRRLVRSTVPSVGSERLGPNVVSLSATKKDRARAIEKQRRAQIEAERQKRWSAPTERK